MLARMIQSQSNDDSSSWRSAGKIGGVGDYVDREERMRQHQKTQKRQSAGTLISVGLFLGLVLCAGASTVWAAAIARDASTGYNPPRPYSEAICNTDPNVFFCEDFEGGPDDLRVFADGNCNSTWRNPGLESSDICYGGGSSHQHPTQVIPGDPAGSNNIVWRMNHRNNGGFVDVLNGINSGSGTGTIAGYLKSSILGTGAQDFYVRWQSWVSADHLWPREIDNKMVFVLPRNFPSPPQADYEFGIDYIEDFFCSGVSGWNGGGNFQDIPIIRYRGVNFETWPVMNEYCPPLPVGAPANNVNAPRTAKERWYTFELHVKLSTSNTVGLLEMWIDGNLAFRTNRWTCNPCPDIGYIMIMNYFNVMDPSDGYRETDNLVMSRAYIGPPTFSPRDATPPAAPTNLRIASLLITAMEWLEHLKKAIVGA